MLTTTVLAPPVVAVGLVTKSSIAVCLSSEEIGAGGGAEIVILDLLFDFFLPPLRPFPCDMMSWVLGMYTAVWCHRNWVFNG